MKAPTCANFSQITGMAKPSFYANFGGKEEFFLRTLQRYAQVVAEPLLQALLSEDVSTRAEFQRLLMTIASTVATKGGREDASYPPAVWNTQACQKNYAM
ncbi:TetR/AcrR family transcriptional regulator [Pseudovibrio axinellae]|nr:TetR/AcrR family transcriptional regulator [Pseudovibrio axinellae]